MESHCVHIVIASVLTQRACPCLTLKASPPGCQQQPKALNHLRKQDSQGDSMYWVNQGGQWNTGLGAMSVVMAAIKPRRRMVHWGRIFVNWHGCSQGWVKTELPQSPGHFRLTFAPDCVKWASRPPSCYPYLVAHQAGHLPLCQMLG